jgi:hypothetical protein
MFDNANGSTRVIGATEGNTMRFELPAGLPSGSDVYIKVALSATDADLVSWERPVHAYFRRVEGTWRLVGFERMPETGSAGH